MKKRLLGQYIVIDPEICHGTPTFRGTRVFVSDVLADVAQGMSWEDISARWHGLQLEAVAEAIRLANAIFAEHFQEYVVEPTPA